MSQIERFKSRMKNANRSTTEYRMSIAEAKNLLEEILLLEKKLQEKSHEVAVNEPIVITRTMDGGTF